MEEIAAVLAQRQVALGTLPLAIEGRPSARAARAVIAAGIEAGVRVVDTADVYGQTGEPPGYAERLLRPFVHDVLVATKGGVVRNADGSRSPCGHPKHLRAACEASLRRLDVPAIDVYQLHRPDPEVPYCESAGALAELADRGLARAVGVSNVSPSELETAMRVCGERLVSVQNVLTLPPRDDASRDPSPRARPVPLAYGLLGGTQQAGSLGERWPAAAEVAGARGVSVQRVAIAWVLTRLRGTVPIVGARRASTIADSAAAVDLELREEELDAMCPNLRHSADDALGG